MSKKIKIMYLIPHLQNNGPVSQLYGLLKYLNREKFEPIVVTFYDERNNSKIEDFRSLKIKIYQLHSSHQFIFRQKKQLRKIIYAIAPDIIHSNSLLTDIIAYRIPFSIPFIMTLHCFIYEDILIQYGRLVGSIMCFLEHRAINKADVVVTCSQTLKDKYEKIIPREYSAIQNGIEMEKWKLENVNKKTLRKKLGLPLDKFIFLSTGLLIKRKDPKTIITAFKNLENRNAFLVILGDGNVENYCRKLADNDLNIRFTGRVSNVKDYLYASDVLISASWSEGLPYAIIEAEVSGIKMILSDIPPHREVVKDNIDEVDFFKVKDYKKLTSIMNKNILNYNKKRISYHVRIFDAKYMSEKYQELYVLSFCSSQAKL